MAELNPSPQPGYDPNYIFWSRPAREQPRGNESGKIIGEGVGKEITQGVGAADQFVKNTIDKNIYDIVDQERSRTTGELAGLAGQQNPLPDSRTQPSTLAPAQPVVPQEVQNSVNRVRSIQSAKDAGKLTELQYWQRLTPELQANRTQFAGYRDYYDRKTAEITGHNPANALMQSYMSIIKEKTDAANADRSKALSLIDGMARDGDIHTKAVLDAYQRNGDYGAVVDAASRSFAYKRDLEATRVKLAQAAEDRAERAEQAGVAEDSYNKTVNHTVAGMMNVPIESAYGSMTPQQLYDRGMDMALHPDKWNDLAAQNFLHQAVAVRAKMAAAIQHDTFFSGAADKVKPAFAEAANKEALAAWDKYIELMGDPKTFPLAMAQAQGTKAIEAGDRYATLNDPNVGSVARKMVMAKDLLGPAAATMLPTLMGDPAATHGIATYNLSNKIDMWNGQPVGEKVQAAKKDLPDKDIGNTTQGFLNQIDIVTNKDAPDKTRAGVFNSFFTPTEANRELLEHLDTPSQYKAFAQLTNREVTRYAAKQGGEPFENYKNTTEAWFNTLMMKNVIPSLVQANQDYYGKGSLSKESQARQGRETPQNSSLTYMWDTEHHQLRLDPASLDLVKKTEGPYYLRSNIMRSLARLNITLGNMSHIQEAAGGNVDEYLVQLLAEEGIRPGQTVAQQGPGQPGEIDWQQIGQSVMTAILAANHKLQSLGEDEETEEGRKETESEGKDVARNQ